MNSRHYIAILMIAAILNPFCCCNAAVKAPEGSKTVSSCPHCPKPDGQSEKEDYPRPCCQDHEFTLDNEKPSLEQIPFIAINGGASQAIELLSPIYSRDIRLQIGSPDLSAGPPLRVRFCTYLL